MADSLSFLRKFINLESHSKTKNLKGFAKIEIKSGKGKLKINIDGLKYIDKENMLKAYLISDYDKKLDKVYIGTVDVKDNGKGNLNWEFKSDSLGGGNLSFDKVDLILIKSSGSNISAYDTISIVGKIKDKNLDVANVLNRFTDETVVKKEIKREISKVVEVEKVDIEDKKVNLSSIDNDLNKSLNEIIDDVKTEDYTEEVNLDTVKVEGFTDENNVFIENVEEFNLQTEDVEVNHEIHEDVKEVNVEDIEVNHEIYDDVEEVNIEDVNNTEAEIKEEDLSDAIEKDYIKFKNLQSEYMNQMNNFYGNSLTNINKPVVPSNNNSEELEQYTMNILQYFKKVDVLKKRMDGYEWFKVETEENKYSEFLPYYHYTINKYYPYPIMYKEITTQKLIKKYNHYLFGVVRENGKVKYYAYGVPGRFKREEQPYGGKTGFMTWIESSVRSRSRYRLGYWILHVDPVSGKIVNPLKPSQPR